MLGFSRVALAFVVLEAMPMSITYAAPTPLRSFKVAAVAYDPAWGDLDGNISRMVTGVENVARQGVKLAVLPETANMGYIFDDFAMIMRI